MVHVEHTELSTARTKADSYPVTQQDPWLLEKMGKGPDYQNAVCVTNTGVTQRGEWFPGQVFREKGKAIYREGLEGDGMLEPGTEV